MPRKESAGFSPGTNPNTFRESDEFIRRRDHERQSNTGFHGAAVGNMGAGTKHHPGQYIFQHGPLANAKQPGNNSPDLYTEHNQPEHESTGTT